MTTASVMSRNIRRKYEQATPEQIEQGIGWYPEAAVLAATLWPNDVERGAAIVAVLTQHTSWAQTRAMVHAVAAGADPLSLPTFPVVRAKVARLLAGEDPDSVVSGQKIRSIWHNIMGRGADVVTVDVHARDIAYGTAFTGTGRKRAVKDEAIGVREYREIAAAYRRVAKRLGVTPQQLQAITWTVHRGTAA